MKTAVLPDGKSINASAKAPSAARCQFCGGPVLLRRRKLMNNGGYVFFWRHSDNQNLNCPGRSRRR